MQEAARAAANSPHEYPAYALTQIRSAARPPPQPLHGNAIAMELRPRGHSEKTRVDELLWRNRECVSSSASSRRGFAETPARRQVRSSICGAEGVMAAPACGAQQRPRLARAVAKAGVRSQDETRVAAQPCAHAAMVGPRGAAGRAPPCAAANRVAEAWGAVWSDVLECAGCAWEPHISAHQAMQKSAEKEGRSPPPRRVHAGALWNDRETRSIRLSATHVRGGGGAVAANVAAGARRPAATAAPTPLQIDVP